MLLLGVLEVKGGLLTYDPPSRTWKRQREKKRLKDPFARTQRCMHWLMRELEHMPKKWMPSLGYGVAFPRSTGSRRILTEPLDLVVDYRDMGELATRIPKLMWQWQRDDRSFGAENVSRHQRQYQARPRPNFSAPLRIQDRRPAEEWVWRYPKPKGPSAGR